VRQTTRSILICIAIWRATSLAAADGQTLHTPESPYDAPPPANPVATPANPVAPPGFGHAGSSELGAAFGVTIAADVRDLSGSLTIGRFVAERFELSALASLANVKAGAQSATLWSTVIEPAYHLALAPSIAGMLGMGVGVAYTHRLGTGLAVAPRIGVRFPVGRFGVVTPTLSYAYVTHRALDPVADLAANAVTRALRIQLGYAITW
jgi:hypothetical protein